MNISPLKSNAGNIAFGHSNPWADSPYNKHERYLIAGTTALGVIGSMAAHAKYHHYSINPLNMFKGLTTNKYSLFSVKQFKHFTSAVSKKYKNSILIK